MPSNKNQKLLTIGMAAYGDFPGVYMTIQALKLYQNTRDCQLVVIDNDPSNEPGSDSVAIRNLVMGMSEPMFHNPKYVPFSDHAGTTTPRQLIFDHADGECVLVMDSHVMLLPGALTSLRDHFADNQESKDIVCGPLLNDRLFILGTHFNYIWRAEMWGRWGQAYTCKECKRLFSCNDELSDGLVHYLDLTGQVSNSPYQAQYIEQCVGCGHIFPKELPWPGHEARLQQAGYLPANVSSQEPFEIPAMGLGLFACRKDAWAGWGYNCRGFGGEECCIHDIHRKEIGGKVLCLPGLRWTHRFAHRKPEYPLSTWNKVRNYVIFFQRLGYDLAPIYDHFVPTGKIEKHAIDFIAADPVANYWPIGGRHLVSRNSPEGKRLIAELEPNGIVVPKGGGGPSPSQTYINEAARVYAEKQAEIAKQSSSGCGGCGKSVAKDQPDLNADWTLQGLYEWVTGIPRDLDKHMPTILEYANRCDHVTDIGHRRESIVALLASTAATVVSYSVESGDPLVNKMLDLIKGRDRTCLMMPGRVSQEVHQCMVPIEDTDLLFIDTKMTFDRILRMLQVMSPHVHKYIIIHDTQLFKDKGEDGGTGILPAVRYWLRDNLEWHPVLIRTEQYGLAVYSRLKEDRKPLPLFAKRVFNFALHAAEHVKQGAPAAPDEIMEARLNICANCEARNVDHCSVCGCPLTKKTSWADQYCDHGKWTPYHGPADTGVPAA